MNNKKIVITGGAGFIGSNLAYRLASENQIIVIDDLSTGYQLNIQDLIDKNQIEFIKGSITNLYQLMDLFKDVDYVFHQGAIPSVPRSITDPISSNHANIDGTLNVLVAAKENGVKKVIFASSSSVYGESPTLPKKESMKPDPLSPYAVCKLAAEYYCNVFTTAYDLKTVSLRYFNVYGPRQDPTGDYAAVVPKFIGKILNDESPIVYGDGEQTRDFTYVDDAVQANINAAESPTCGIFNVSGGKRITINTLAKMIMGKIGKNIEITHTDPRPGDIMHSLADISKAKNQFNYKPEVNLETGLKETIKWFQK